MDLMSGNMVIFWIVSLILFVVLEALSAQLVSIWFAGGSVVALVLSLLNTSIKIQIAAFVISSAVFLIIALPTIRKHLKMDSVPMNADLLIGMDGIVTMDIYNKEETGQIKVRGQYWSARNIEDDVIPTGSRVKIISIEGVHANVQKITEE